jgi:hypothetical protein
MSRPPCITQFAPEKLVRALIAKAEKRLGVAEDADSEAPAATQVCVTSPPSPLPPHYRCGQAAT